MDAIDRRRLLLALGGVLAVAPALAGALPSMVYDDPDDLYAALRDKPSLSLPMTGGTIAVVFADDVPGVNRPKVLAWVRHAARALTTYFGRFPVDHLGLLIIAEDSDKVGHATTFGYAGSAIRIHVGMRADDGALARDWVLVHEMMHAALPDLPRRALWLQEGSATYLEPIARTQAGELAVTEVWRQSLAGMPRGQPNAGEGGMDGTDAWGRLYWGGATFWLLAEVGIFEATQGRGSLREALRAINRASGGNSIEWSPEQMMQTGDMAVGGVTLATLYRRFADQRIETDLYALFARLGVVGRPDGAIAFDDSAPLARLRQRITRA